MDSWLLLIKVNVELFITNLVPGLAALVPSFQSPRREISYGTLTLELVDIIPSRVILAYPSLRNMFGPTALPNRTM